MRQKATEYNRDNNEKEQRLLWCRRARQPPQTTKYANNIAKRDIFRLLFLHFALNIHTSDSTSNVEGAMRCMLCVIFVFPTHSRRRLIHILSFY